MTAKLREVRRRFPPEDASAYASAYAEAALAERLGTLVHRLRVGARMDVAELAARMGVEEDEVLLAEEGDASLTLAYLDRLARAVGSPVTVSAAEVGVVLGSPATSPPPPPEA